MSGYGVLIKHCKISNSKSSQWFSIPLFFFLSCNFQLKSFKLLDAEASAVAQEVKLLPARQNDI